MIRIFMFLVLALCVIIEKSHGEDPQEHIKYLIQYGYFEPPKRDAATRFSSKKEIESALKNAQKFGAIPVTGKLDIATINMISTPRCGVTDMRPNLEHYVANNTKWDRKSLTYCFKKYSTKYRPLLLENKFHEACQKWAKPTGLIFTRFPPILADIRIGFYVGDHGDGTPFDNKTLGHSNYPTPDIGTNLHINDDFKFVLTETEHPKEEISILSVFMHELGHALGLGHSDIRESVMYPFILGVTDLHEDDILGIQSLYGKAS